MRMRKPQLYSALLATLMLSCAAALAQNVSDKPQSAEAAATQGLALLRAMASDNARDLGFASSAEAARATLGAPLSVYSVDLAALGAFKPGDDAAALLKSVPAAFYTVLLDGSVRSAVRVEKTDAGWNATRIGNAGLATAVARARSALPTPDDPNTALVQVLALNLVFVGQKGAGGWLLAPVIDDASVKLKVGSVERAADVLARLAPLAARHTGDPT
jgi:hypothetical protein